MIKVGQTLEVPALVETHTEHEKHNHSERRGKYHPHCTAWRHIILVSKKVRCYD